MIYNQSLVMLKESYPPVVRDARNTVFCTRDITNIVFKDQPFIRTQEYFTELDDIQCILGNHDESVLKTAKIFWRISIAHLTVPSLWEATNYVEVGFDKTSYMRTFSCIIC